MRSFFVLVCMSMCATAVAQVDTTTLHDLVDHAREHGSVPIIVVLDVAFELEGRLSSDLQVTEQRSRIEQAQQVLLDGLSSRSISGIKTFATVPFVALRVNEESLLSLAGLQGVQAIHEDRLMEPLLEESVDIVGAPLAWNLGYTGAGQAVAILDTGTDIEHPFLEGRVVAEACFSENDPVVYNSISLCPNGESQQIGPGSSVPPSTHCQGLQGSGCSHGTHVAGIALGHIDERSGVAPAADLISVQVFSRFNHTDCGTSGVCLRARWSDIMLGLEYVYDLRSEYSIASVNLSLGGGSYTSSCDNAVETQFLKPFIDNLRSVGIATIAAAGNDGYSNAISLPACISSVVSVGSVGNGSGNVELDHVAPLSNSATILDLLAPGHTITSSMIGGGYGPLAGTSMAAPHVAGAWAVLKQARPGATVDEVLFAFVSSGVPITDPKSGLVHPRLQIEAALLEFAGADYFVGSSNQGPGWYMFSTPLSGTTIQQLAATNLVYGIPGEYPETDGTNPLIGYVGDGTISDDYTVSGYVKPTHVTNPLEPGRGFIWYLWGTELDDGDRPEVTGEANPGSSAHQRMPFDLTFVGSPVMEETFQVTFTEADRVSGGGDKWYLIGNPFLGGYDVSGIDVSGGATLSEMFQYWDPTEAGGNGAYVCIDKHDDDCLSESAPIMGFFAEVGDVELPLTFTFGSARSDRNVAERRTARFALSGDLLVNYQGQDIPVPIVDDNVRVLFSDDATDGRDRLDAGKLDPLNAYYWANIALMGAEEDGRERRTRESRPFPNGPVVISLALTTFTNGLQAGGQFTISLVDQDLGDGWQVHLTDLETGTTVNLLTDSYSFSIETQPAIDGDERFEVTFTPPTVSDEDGGEGYAFGLEAVWPNPATTTTQVAFTLEEAGDVSLDVFDVLGRRVSQVATGEFASARHVLPLNTQQLASGVYVVRLIAGSKSAVQRVTVVR